MVTFDEVDDSSSSSPPPPLPPPTLSPVVAPPPAEQELASQSRLLDAEAIEEVAKKMTRISARMHLESLAKKLRKESEALKRVEKSKDDMSKENNNASDNTVVHQGAAAAAAAAAVQEETATATTTTSDEKKPSSLPPKTMKPPAVAAISPSAKFIPVDRFSFDAGGYNSAFVTIYVPLPGVGSISRELVTCEFTKSSFDLIVRNLKDGKSSSYRLFKDNLEHDIDNTNSKITVKADKVIVKLAKAKKDYGGFDYWTKLIDNKKGHKAAGGHGGAKEENPQDSIMKLMRNMYEEGDDNMKKMIGETMMKQQRGELNQPAPDKMKNNSMGGKGHIGDMNLDDDDEDF